MAALTLLQESNEKGEFATGLLYIEPNQPTFTDLLNTVDTPLSMLGADKTRPAQGRARRDHGPAAVVASGTRGSGLGTRTTEEGPGRHLPAGPFVFCLPEA